MTISHLQGKNNVVKYEKSGKEVQTMIDVAVIGGGPGGISAALTLRQRGKSVTIVSSGEADSHLAKAHRVDNYPGMPEMSGTEMLEQMTRQARERGVEFMRGRATSILPMGETFGIAVGSDYLEARAVILTTGMNLGRLYPGEAEYLGRGVSYCATCDGMMYRGKSVAVIGLSEDAPEESRFLSEIGCQVEYFDRSRAKQYEIRGEQTVTALVADGAEFPVQGVFILRSGVAPEQLLTGLTTAGGAITVERNMQTSVPGVFAAGDCTGAPYQIAKSVGEGNIAALSAVKYLDTKE